MVKIKFISKQGLKTTLTIHKTKVSIWNRKEHIINTLDTPEQALKSFVKELLERHHRGLRLI